MPDITNLVSGPATVKVDDTELAHTQGGITFSLNASQRTQTVDKYGSSAVGIVHMGDEVGVTAPFGEWDIAIFDEIYQPGDYRASGSSSAGTSQGFGRSAGYVYTTADLKVVPIATSLAEKLVQIFKAVPVGEFELTFDTESDRIFNVQYTAIVDETKDDGRLLGAIFDNDA